ncbi:hypothetical protein Kpol_1045p31 [Vanderwaltozyma polyspora DSM 70294]|uniref:Dol-P-Man:Man(5)GlcNAc(2)-PP-Dol alpha-1,3-mannosyltransferase n=1 Tax=Vanderwaltozyma polyspora (strain ATCC 22028 / DSM 70294 / BCRC 21397 / CBS 2163 / NBRC 10782 / NRRL Y-8283 / UCD 57-17) TaxID=436907 RepID=A7TI38_VANPO|nr:uncharacterized protein Kpol_1045p31 [Vanderwaltozyma polyspora DSM 70294]EDO18045.1 hypothetical protein Kpol_1045p31 [Vanderwaltozyma polyspora DSM 70294]
MSTGAPKKESNDSEKQFQRPPFEPWKDLKNGIRYMLCDTNANKIIMPLLLMLESAALKLIIAKVQYTEIDYTAYMEQIDMIKNGELDYSEIRGGTGPLVYPAGHVWIYKIMDSLTNGVNDISSGQQVFRYLYLLTLLIQFITYYQLQLPPWCVVLACLSKRLHSIYVLRLFNDCFTVLFVSLAILLFVVCTNIKSYPLRYAICALASISYTIAISIKMNALLYFPGVLVSIFILTDGHLINSIICGMLIVVWQIIVAIPFLNSYPTEYFHSAFNFSRQFMFKWSVNWQMLTEDGFNDKLFHSSLLFSQLLSIITIILSQCPYLFKYAFNAIAHPLTRQNFTQLNKQRIIPVILITTNFAGVLFSRSLHYQFLSWYHWTIPILISWSKLPIFVAPIWYIAHEYCWNSYPPNLTASWLLFSLNSLLLTLVVMSTIPNFTDTPVISTNSGKKTTDKEKKNN